MLVYQQPSTRPPLFPKRVQPKYKPIGGIQAAGSGLRDTSGTVLTIGAGVTRKPGVIDFSAQATGYLGRTVSVAGFPASFVYAGTIRGPSTDGGINVLGAINTNTDFLMRVYESSGLFAAQALGATTFSSASTGAVAGYGTRATVVAVYESPTKRTIYVRSTLGLFIVTDTTDTGATGTLDRLSIGGYDGSQNVFNSDGQFEIAQWLGVALTATEASLLLDNPWALFPPVQGRLWAPSSASGFFARPYYDMIGQSHV